MATLPSGTPPKWASPSGAPSGWPPTRRAGPLLRSEGLPAPGCLPACLPACQWTAVSCSKKKPSAWLQDITLWPVLEGLWLHVWLCPLRCLRSPLPDVIFVEA